MKRIIFTLNLILLAINIMAQVPAGFNYQAVVRNSSGDIVANKTVKFKFSILRNSETGTAVYVETQSATTNSFGLANLKVGMGTKVSGTFDPSAWGSNKHYLKVELDPNNGTSFYHLGTEQLQAVPYAFHSQTVQDIPDNSVTTDKINPGAVTGAKIAQSGAANGQALKWNGTVWAPADDIEGGLHVPVSFVGNSSGPLFSIINWGTGGSISALSSGGYGIYGESTSTSGIGVHGTNKTSTGATFGIKGEVLSQSGYSGYFTGGRLYIQGNTGIGTTEPSAKLEVAGQIKITGGNPGNGKVLTSDASGLASWVVPGPWLINGSNLYYNSGYVGIGTNSPGAGLHIKANNWPGSFIYFEANSGEDAGMRLYEGSTVKWHIHNDASAGGFQIVNNALNIAVFCQQSTGNVGIGTNTPSYKLQVGNSGDGTQARANAWNTFSDARLKKDFVRLSDPLEMINKINGYYFSWCTGADKSRQVGFSAQEVQKVLPEVVSEGEDGYLSIEYGKMTSLLLEAIKELKAENDLLKGRLEKLEQLVGVIVEN